MKDIETNSRQQLTGLIEPQVKGIRMVLNGRDCMVYRNEPTTLDDERVAAAREKSNHRVEYPTFEEQGGWVEHRKGQTIFHNGLPEAYRTGQMEPIAPIMQQSNVIAELRESRAAESTPRVA